MTALHTTREGWLTALAYAMRPQFEALGYTLPGKLRVGMSWPTRKAVSDKSRTIGQCFNPTCSKDGTTEVFVSPVLDEPLRVADVLAHELIHAAIGTEAKHGPKFAKAARALGLEGKPTATIAGEEFVVWARPLVESLGAYPHASLDVTKEPAKEKSNRQLKVKCAECGYTCRTTRKWLEKAGAPLCPTCTIFESDYTAIVRMEEEATDEPAEPEARAA